MIVFSAITPHPPIIIPEVGKGETKKVKKTISAMEKLAKDLEEAEPDTIIVITPHGLVYPNQMNICGMEKLIGDFSTFGAPEPRMSFKNDLLLADKLDRAGRKNGVKTILYHNGDRELVLDYGVLVPLYFLTQGLTEIEVLPIAYSYQSRAEHFSFGEIIAETCGKSKKRIAIIASGDLSHRLIPSAPAGYNASGKQFDKLLMNYLKEKDIQGILEMDEGFVEEAGECAYRSILILLGTIEKLDWQPEILSYEGPFGVGYLVANLKIKEATITNLSHE